MAQNAATKNYCLNGSETFAIFINDELFRVRSISSAANADLSLIQPSCFQVGDLAILFNVKSCPKTDGKHTVTAVTDANNITLDLDSSDAGDPTADRSGTLLGAPQDLTGQTLACSIYNRDTRIIGVPGEIETVAGSNIYLVRGDPEAIEDLLGTGDLISIPQAGISKSPVQGISAASNSQSCGGCSGSDQEYTIVGQNNATETVTEARASLQVASESRSTLLSSAAVAILDAPYGEITITFPALPTGKYLYELVTTTASISEVLLTGTVEYI